MDILTAAIIACSLHSDEALVRALVQGQSQSVQYFVGDLTELKGSGAPRQREEAAALLLTVEKKGHRAALGFLGIPADWAEAFGHQPADLWDACVNISVGTAKLSEFDYECRSPKRQTPRPTANRACIVRRFARALNLPAPQVTLFVSGILANLRDIARRPAIRQAPAEGHVDAQPNAEWSTDLFFGREPAQVAPLLPFAPGQ